MESLKQAIFEHYVKREAKEMDVDTEGKDNYTIAKEVQEKKIMQSADKLGIDTEGKNPQQLLNEIVSDYAEEAKELNVFPFEQKKHTFHQGHHLMEEY